MALKALDIFKLTPKKNCKECGFPTCMAFSMKVASGAVEVSACPKMAPEALAKLADCSSLKELNEIRVLYLGKKGPIQEAMKSMKDMAPEERKTFGQTSNLVKQELSKAVEDKKEALENQAILDKINEERIDITLPSFKLDQGSLHPLSTIVAELEDLFLGMGYQIAEGPVDAKIEGMKVVNYERIGEIMKPEFAYVKYNDNKDNFLAIINKIKDSDVECAYVLEVADADVAKEAVAALAGLKPVVIGANKDNFAAMIDVVKADGLALGVQGANLEELYTTVQAIEAADYKELIIDVTGETVKDTYVNAVQVRRIALKEGDRSFGYPSFVNVAKLANGDANLEIALSSVFTVKYGTILAVEDMTYAKALPLYALRQNIFTDPQKPMRVEAKVYPLNNPDKNSPVLCSVDFALTYFTITGDIEASKVPCWLMIPDAGGYSVLTAWSAGKFGGSVIGAFAKECNIESYTDCRDIVIPGKLAVIKPDVADNMPGWNVVVGPLESMELPKFLKEYAANH